MRMFTERTQVLLSREQLARLKRAARRGGRSVGGVIREAIDAYTTASSDRRRDAVRHLLAMDAPVDDWDVMKAEIIRGATGEE